MDAAEFDQLMNMEIIPRLCKLLAPRGTKQREYASEEDRFSNFKRRAQMLRCEPMGILMSDMSKHVEAIIKATVDDTIGKDDWVFQRIDGSEGYKQKYLDAIAYLCLGYGMQESRHKHV